MLKKLSLSDMQTFQVQSSAFIMWLTETEYKSQIELTKYIPYLTILGKLWDLFGEDLDENWPCCNGTTLYSYTDHQPMWWLQSNIYLAFVIMILTYMNLKLMWPNHCLSNRIPSHLPSHFISSHLLWLFHDILTMYLEESKDLDV